VKAQNVIREPGGRFVLMDFGAGRFVETPHSAANHAVGTPLYLAPEVLYGRCATVQSDIYAVGVLLYVLVTRNYPVMGASTEDLVTAHIRGQRCHLRDARPDLPDAFVAAVERALEPDPERRYSTTGEMLSALGPDTAGTSGRPTTIRTSINLRNRWISRYTTTAAAIGLPCVAAAAVSLMMWHSHSPSTIPPESLSTVALLERERELHAACDLRLEEHRARNAENEHHLAELRRKIRELNQKFAAGR
jgi:serine/threonine protein kinase